MPGRVLADTTVETVSAAVDRLEPDCILLDGSGRGDYGPSWLDAIAVRARARPIPMVMFTAHRSAMDEATAGESARSQAAAFAAVLPKPFELDVPVATVARVLRDAGQGTVGSADARPAPGEPLPRQE